MKNKANAKSAKPKTSFSQKVKSTKSAIKQKAITTAGMRTARSPTPPPLTRRPNSATVKGFPNTEKQTNMQIRQDENP